MTTVNAGDWERFGHGQRGVAASVERCWFRRAQRRGHGGNGLGDDGAELGDKRRDPQPSVHQVELSGDEGAVGKPDEGEALAVGPPRRVEGASERFERRAHIHHDRANGGEPVVGEVPTVQVGRGYPARSHADIGSGATGSLVAVPSSVASCGSLGGSVGSAWPPSRPRA